MCEENDEQWGRVIDALEAKNIELANTVANLRIALQQTQESCAIVSANYTAEKSRRQLLEAQVDSLRSSVRRRLLDSFRNRNGR